MVLGPRRSPIRERQAERPFPNFASRFAWNLRLRCLFRRGGRGIERVRDDRSGYENRFFGNVHPARRDGKNLQRIWVRRDALQHKNAAQRRLRRDGHEARIFGK